MLVRWLGLASGRFLIYDARVIKPFEPHFMKVGVLTAALQELTPRDVRDADPDRAIEEWVEFARTLPGLENGRVIHENAEVKYPTGAAWVRKEVDKGPILLQSDHGPVAWRNVRVRPAGDGKGSDSPR